MTSFISWLMVVPFECLSEKEEGRAVSFPGFNERCGTRISGTRA